MRKRLSRRQKFLKYTVRLFVVLAVLHAIRSAIIVPGFWGPSVVANLGADRKLVYRMRNFGGSNDKQLRLISPERITEFSIDSTFASGEYVVFRILDDDKVWIESRGRVFASIDLTSGDFRSYHHRKHVWAKLGNGEVLAEGWAIAWWQFFVPW